MAAWAERSAAVRAGRRRGDRPFPGRPRRAAASAFPRRRVAARLDGRVALPGPGPRRGGRACADRRFLARAEGAARAHRRSGPARGALGARRRGGARGGGWAGPCLGAFLRRASGGDAAGPAPGRRGGRGRERAGGERRRRPEARADRRPTRVSRPRRGGGRGALAPRRAAPGPDRAVLRRARPRRVPPAVRPVRGDAARSGRLRPRAHPVRPGPFRVVRPDGRDRLPLRAPPARSWPGARPATFRIDPRGAADKFHV